MKRILARLDARQQRTRALAIPLAVVKRYGEHGGSRMAATISYYCFFSVFPLLLAFVTILNRVLADDPDRRRELLDGVLGQLPVIGTQLGGDDAALGGSLLTVVVGLGTAVWAGLGAVGALQQALDEMSDVPVHGRASFPIKKLRSLAFLVAFGIGLSASTFLASLASVFDVGPVAGVGSVLATLVVNVAILLMMFTVLPAKRRTWRTILPGAIVGGVLLTALLQLGRWVVERYITGASDTYGTFAIVIALLSWFTLVSQIVLLSDEANDVLAHRLWPRSVFPGSALTDADRRAALLDMQRVQRDARFDFALSVGDDVIGTDATQADGEPPSRDDRDDAAAAGRRLS